MLIDLKEQWIADLESGNYDQCEGSLHRVYIEGEGEEE